MPLAVKAKAMNILLTWNKFSFTLIASSDMVFKGFFLGFLCLPPSDDYQFRALRIALVTNVICP